MEDFLLYGEKSWIFHRKGSVEYGDGEYSAIPERKGNAVRQRQRDAPADGSFGGKMLYPANGADSGKEKETAGLYLVRTCHYGGGCVGSSAGASAAGTGQTSDRVRAML